MMKAFLNNTALAIVFFVTVSIFFQILAGLFYAGYCFMFWKIFPYDLIWTRICILLSLLETSRKVYHETVKK